MKFKSLLNRNDVLLKVASLAIAVLLWLQVQSKVDHISQREYSVPIEMRNLNKDYVITRAPSHITVVAEGSKKNLQDLDPDRMEAYVNLRQARIGQKEYPVELNILRKLDIKLSLKHPKEIIHIEKLACKDSMVTLEERGLPPSDLLYSGSEVIPKLITMIGPESLISKCAKTRVMINLSQARPGESFPASIEILGRNNQPIHKVRAEPSVVMITPLVTAAPAKKRLLINPIWKGNPAFGFKIKSYTIYPNQVEVHGNSSQLASLSSLETEPIILDNLQSNKTFLIQLKMPKNINIIGESVIRLKVQIGPAEHLP